MPARKVAVRAGLAAVQRRTAVEPDAGEAPILDATDAALFDHPLLVLSGSRALPARQG